MFHLALGVMITSGVGSDRRPPPEPPLTPSPTYPETGLSDYIKKTTRVLVKGQTYLHLARPRMPAGLPRVSLFIRGLANELGGKDRSCFWGNLSVNGKYPLPTECGRGEILNTQTVHFTLMRISHRPRLANNLSMSRTTDASHNSYSQRGQMDNKVFRGSRTTQVLRTRI